MAGGPPLGQQPPGGLSPGDQVLVFYDDPTEQQWHARLLLSCITGDEWIILTPDGDIYGEQISSGNPDFLAWRPMDPNNVIPVGINRAQVYGFRVFPDPAALARLTAEGQRHAAQERVRRGLAGGVQGGGGGPAGQIAPLAGGQSQGRQSQSQTSLETQHLRVVFPPPVGWQGLCKLWVQIRVRTVVQMQGRYPFREM